MKTHKKNELPYLFFALFVAIFPQSVFAGYFKNLGIKDGLSQMSVVSIHQDALGRIWLGTHQGLSIYDGREMITLKGGNPEYDKYIKRNVISKIVDDAHHNILFKADHALMKYQLDKEQFSCIKPNGVTSVSSVRGKVYVTVRDSILTWNEKINRLQFFMKAEVGGATVLQVLQTRDNSWWASTSMGLYKKVEEQWLCVLPDTYIYRIFQSRAGDIWVGTRNKGMYKIGIDGRVTSYVTNPLDSNTICHNDVRTILEDSQGNLWIGTKRGLNKYSLKENKFEVYVDDGVPGSLPHSSIYTLLLDKNDNLWVGTYYGGVGVMAPNDGLYHYFTVSSVQRREGANKAPFVGYMVEDKRSNLWICTDDGKLSFMDRKTGMFRSFNLKPFSQEADNLKSICYDSENEKLYIGLSFGGLVRFDITTHRFDAFYEKTNTGEVIKNVFQVCMYQGKVIFLSYEGVLMLDPQSGTFTKLVDKGAFLSFLVDSKKRIWAFSVNKMISVNLQNIEERKEVDFEGLVGNYNFCCACESEDGSIYISTEGNGLVEYNPTTEHTSVYKSDKNGLLDDYCFNITNSKHGRLVLLSNRGLSFFNTITKRIDYTAIGDRFPLSAFNVGNGLLAAQNGDLFVGSTNGLLVLSEDKLRVYSQSNSLYFSNLYVNNVRATPGDDTQILHRIISYTNLITLNHNQNNLVVTFANNDFGSALSPAFYEYKLEGFNNKWQRTEVEPLTYTNLHPGKYVLKIRERSVYDSQEDKPVKEIQLVIVIRPPVYNTWWAWVIYVLLVGIVLYIMVSGRYKQMKLRASLKYERIEKEHIAELNRMKLEFFTNISHELRTPLTLIITQAEMLLSHKESTKSVREKVSKLYKYAYQMRALISELLDFHKLEQNQVRLKVQEQNLVPFLSDIYSSFRVRAESLDMNYTFSSGTEVALCYYDSAQLQKVFFNLLENAFKYTRTGGRIEMSLVENDSEITIRVMDNGMGISRSDLTNIFERFYQSSTNSLDFSSGIGLALCKDIVCLHHGGITVESKPDYGSIFIVRLKKGMSHFTDDLKVTVVNETLSSMDAHSLPDTKFIELLQENIFDESDVAHVSQPYSILIIEDNEELLALLDSIFSPLYRVLTAENGEVGLKIAIDEQPSMVVSDVMMPKMSGIEMCRLLKSNVVACHIPVLLLTARTAPDQYIEGLLAGADDYVTKPFHAKVLLAKVNALIRNRELLQRNFRKEPKAHFELLAGNELDQKLLRKTEEMVEKYIEDPDFDVDRLAQMVGMGRSSFFEKLKALTGMTPANFILNYRLKKAAALLISNPKMQMDDIAAQLGFSSGRYFSRCFKNHFNITPQQYKENYGSKS